jgi:signal transduction histidine kinase
MVALTATLFSFSVVLYGGFSKILYGDLDDLLSSKAEGIANAIDAYRYVGKVDMPSFIDAADGWMSPARKDPELMSVYTQIIDKNGSRIVSSNPMPQMKALDKDVFEDILDGEDSFDTLKGMTPDGKKMKFRVYTKPIYEDGTVKYAVQAAGPVTLVSLALNNLILILFVLLPLTVLLAGIPGLLLVRLTLKPVDRMIDTLRQITAENLKLKIHIPDTKDEIKRLADTFNDMIDRLDRSFSSQQRFIQDISNELKVPMQDLEHECRRAIQNSMPEADLRQLLNKASTEIEGFSRKIDNLLTLSGSGKTVLEIRKVDLGNLASRTLGDVKVLAEEKDMELLFSCPEKVVLDGDEEKLKVLLLNMYDNAIKYTYRKGKVSVTIRKDGRKAKVYVNDTGIGIPFEEQPYIFDRFYQVQSPRSIKGGFGLGLSSARSIVDAHKGDISVESQPGKGATFIVTLPLSYPG